MFKKHLLSIALTALVGTAFGQRICGTTEYMQEQFATDPGYEERLRAIEEFTQEWIANNPGGERAVITIPVVVHVVYNTTAENLSDAQILSQITVLNEDFRRLNADASSTPSHFTDEAADTEIEFCLAAQDPSGAATTGITRKSTTKTSFSSSANEMKFSTYGTAIWDRNKYLNIWVCDLSSGLLGYAQFPGGSSSTDGVVCDYLYFGSGGSASAPFDLGRTATHEVGHWLNLYHIWGDDGTSCSGSDLVSDTPNQQNENYGCPTGKIGVSACSGSTDGDMYQNYMDYTDDACMNLFTAGQKTRMQALFSTGGSRVSIATSIGCTPPGGGGTCSAPTGMSTTSITTSGATLNWGAASGAVSYNIQYRISGGSTWTSTTSTTTSKAISGLAAGTTYEWQVQTVCASSSSAFTSSTTFTTTGGSSCSDPYESNNTSSTATTISAGVTIQGLIGSSTDVDWYKFTTTSPNTKIKVSLTSLPADYDIKLYNSSVAQKGVSENGGTANETIIWNTTGSGTRYIQVYGWSGAMSTSDCYDLLVETRSTNWKTDGSETVLGDSYENTILGIVPNPVVSGSVTYVHYFSVQDDSNVEIIVTDMMGNVVQTSRTAATYGENMLEVNTNDLTSGMYIVQISNGKSRYNEKFIIQ
ncbi:MAG: M43 family zinc metalloprotease [Chitinophagales bacterium]